MGWRKAAAKHRPSVEGWGAPMPACSKPGASARKPWTVERRPDRRHRIAFSYQHALHAVFWTARSSAPSIDPYGAGTPQLEPILRGYAGGTRCDPSALVS